MCPKSGIPYFVSRLSAFSSKIEKTPKSAKITHFGAQFGTLGAPRPPFEKP